VETAARPEVIRLPDGSFIPDERLDVAIIRPARELDCSTGPELVIRVGRFLRSNRSGSAEIPLDGVEFIDAAGMRSLMDCRQLALRSRRALTFTDASPVVRRLVELLGETALPLDPAPLETVPCEKG
jgi:anti-anti-sigma regulatory factor